MIKIVLRSSGEKPLISIKCRPQGGENFGGIFGGGGPFGQKIGGTRVEGGGRPRTPV